MNPKAEVHVIFTGDWSLPGKEADAVDVLLEKGCDVFTCHVDSPKVIVENVAKAGKYVCGYHASQADLAGDKYLTGAEWNWEKVYVDYINKIKKGEKIPNYMRGGLKEGIVRTSPYGPKVTDDAKTAADAAKAKLMNGDLHHLQGPAQGSRWQGRDPGRNQIRAGRSRSWKRWITSSRASWRSEAK